MSLIDGRVHALTIMEIPGVYVSQPLDGIYIITCGIFRRLIKENNSDARLALLSLLLEATLLFILAHILKFMRAPNSMVLYR